MQDAWLIVRVLLTCIHTVGKGWLNNPEERIHDHVLESLWRLSWECGYLKLKCGVKHRDSDRLCRTTLYYLNLLNGNISSCILCFAEVLKINTCLLNTVEKKMYMFLVASLGHSFLPL